VRNCERGQIANGVMRTGSRRANGVRSHIAHPGEKWGRRGVSAGFVPSKGKGVSYCPWRDPYESNSMVGFTTLPPVVIGARRSSEQRGSGLELQ